MLIMCEDVCREAAWWQLDQGYTVCVGGGGQLKGCEGVRKKRGIGAR